MKAIALIGLMMIVGIAGADQPYVMPTQASDQATVDNLIGTLGSFFTKGSYTGIAADGSQCQVGIDIRLNPAGGGWVDIGGHSFEIVDDPILGTSDYFLLEASSSSSSLHVAIVTRRQIEASSDELSVLDAVKTDGVLTSLKLRVGYATRPTRFPVGQPIPVSRLFGGDCESLKPVN